MASKVQKPCKICGKMFTPCADCEKDKTMFHWKRVACSPECAKEYFAKVEASRQPKVEHTDSQPVEKVSTGTSDKVNFKKIRKKNEESEQIG